MDLITAVDIKMNKQKEILTQRSQDYWHNFRSSNCLMNTTAFSRHTSCVDAKLLTMKHSA